MIPTITQLLVFLVIGAGVGFLGGLVGKTGLNALQNVGLGIAGSLVAGTQIVGRIGSAEMFGSPEVTAYVWGVIGALLVLAVFVIFNQLTESKSN